MTIEGIYGRKIGMTQLFEENGEAVPVTVIDTSANVVVQVKTSKTDGYNAVQVGYGSRKRVNEPMKGHPNLGKFAIWRVRCTTSKSGAVRESRLRDLRGR